MSGRADGNAVPLGSRSASTPSCDAGHQATHSGRGPLIPLGTVAECFCGDDIHFLQDVLVADQGWWVHVESGTALCYPSDDPDCFAEPISEEEQA